MKNKIDPHIIVHSLNVKEVKILQDIFNELFIILVLHKEPHKNMRLYLKRKRSKFSGKLKKICTMMLSGDNLEGGVINNIDDLLKGYENIKEINSD